MLQELDFLFSPFYQEIQQTPLACLSETVPKALAQRFADYTHGLLPNWLTALTQLPQIPLHKLDLKESVSVGDETSLDSQQRSELKERLQQFHPWRKGPYFIHGVHIDTEWRSDWKWQRIRDHLSPLEARCVLDIGCGSGYHCWRMVGEGAKLVVGIDPSQLFMMQFAAIKHFLGPKPVHFLPIGIEYLPPTLKCFDTVFSMGIFYHRKSPFEHLAQLKSLLREQGELVLETLVIDGDENTVLVPDERYACMPNVWFIPSTLALEKWLLRAGFKNVKCVDVNQTSLEEQRTTDWMQYQSLRDFLASNDRNKTIEGYPAPKRATFIASA